MLNQYPQIRVGLYVVSATLTAVGIVVTVVSTEWGAALLAAAGSLSIAANMTAANNVTSGGGK